MHLPRTRPEGPETGKESGCSPPPPEPKPENPLLWAPKPDVCWDSDPKVGAF